MLGECSKTRVMLGECSSRLSSAPRHDLNPFSPTLLLSSRRLVAASTVEEKRKIPVRVTLPFLPPVWCAKRSVHLTFSIRRLPSLFLWWSLCFRSWSSSLSLAGGRVARRRIIWELPPTAFVDIGNFGFHLHLHRHTCFIERSRSILEGPATRKKPTLSDGSGFQSVGYCSNIQYQSPCSRRIDCKQSNHAGLTSARLASYGCLCEILTIPDMNPLMTLWVFLDASGSHSKILATTVLN